ncbi:hypothetical protein JW835_04390 [bacterium]|nr:hypothetical protein [bacterium]
MQLNDNIIFVGIKINEKLRDQLDSSKESVKHLFADNNSKFLQILEIDTDDYIAKTIKNGASLDELSNMSMNLKSILKMICPRFSLKEDAIRIYAHTSSIPKKYY